MQQRGAPRLACPPLGPSQSQRSPAEVVAAGGGEAHRVAERVGAAGQGGTGGECKGQHPAAAACRWLPPAPGGATGETTARPAPFSPQAALKGLQEPLQRVAGGLHRAGPSLPAAQRCFRRLGALQTTSLGPAEHPKSEHKPQAARRRRHLTPQ